MVSMFNTRAKTLAHQTCRQAVTRVVTKPVYITKAPAQNPTYTLENQDFFLSVRAVEIPSTNTSVPHKDCAIPVK